MRTIIGKGAFALLSTLLVAAPAMAQDQSTPLLRVYLDAPYFYDFLADIGDPDASGHYPIHLYLEGKEVGEANVVYDCAAGTHQDEVTTEWSGNAATFVDAALLSFAQIYCGS